LARKFLPSLLALTAVSRIPNACTILAAERAERARQASDLQARSGKKKERASKQRNAGSRLYSRIPNASAAFGGWSFRQKLVRLRTVRFAPTPSSHRPPLSAFLSLFPYVALSPSRF